MNDADIEQARLESIGNTIANLADKGICSHGWQGPVVPMQPEGEYKCFHCGKIFSSSEAIMTAHIEFMRTYT